MFGTTNCVDSDNEGIIIHSVKKGQANGKKITWKSAIINYTTALHALPIKCTSSSIRNI